MDVLTQISAIEAALDKVALGLLDGHARHCVVAAETGDKDGVTEELMASGCSPDPSRLTARS